MLACSVKRKQRRNKNPDALILLRARSEALKRLFCIFIESKPETLLSIQLTPPRDLALRTKVFLSFHESIRFFISYDTCNVISIRSLANVPNSLYYQWKVLCFLFAVVGQKKFASLIELWCAKLTIPPIFSDSALFLRPVAKHHRHF